MKNMFQHYFHYGAICCSKCKAFFRRCTRNADKYGPIANVFPCLSGTNNCELNYLSTVSCDLKEFKCKKCRLRKCLDAGMYYAVLRCEHFWFQKQPFLVIAIFSIDWKIFFFYKILSVFDDFSKWRVPNMLQHSEKSSNIAKIAGKWRKSCNFYCYFNGRFWNQKCS